MDRPARLFLCARCRAQVVLCRYCDHGQRYCTRSCSRLARGSTRRQSAQRYQRSRGGRMAHAARTQRWRARQRCIEPGASGALANKVTHQGSQDPVPDAPLAGWSHDSATSNLDSAAAQATTLTAITNYSSVCGIFPYHLQRWQVRIRGEFTYFQPSEQGILKNDRIFF